MERSAVSGAKASRGRVVPHPLIPSFPHSLIHFTHLPAHDAPGPPILPRPYPQVAIRAAHDPPTQLHRESRAERGDRDVRADASHAQLLRFVLAEPDDSRSVRLEILRLRAELAVRSREE